MIKCLIVDDELIAHQILEQYILQTPGLVLTGKCRNALEAFAKLEQQAIDLMFLDIDMPLVNGISFLKTLTHPPKVVFTTAYAEYALEGYELNVMDYLLKPFPYDRFLKAVEKVKQVSNTVPAPVAHSPTGHLVIKEKDGWLKIAYEDIIYIEASKDYMKVITGARSYLTHLTMKKLEEELPAQQFVRVHKSYIVSLSQIRLLKVDSLVLGNGVSVLVSASYKEEVMGKFRGG